MPLWMRARIGRRGKTEAEEGREFGGTTGGADDAGWAKVNKVN